MIKKIKIGITQRVDRVESYEEYRDALDQRLINWVIHSGFIPVPIPNSLFDVTLSNNLQPNMDNWLNEVDIDVILLSGGNNIGDSKQRDLTEEYLLLWAEKYEKSVLGICRGMQMMGVYAGGRLIEIDGHTRVHHQLKMKNIHTQLLPESVNSYHNFALEKCPNEYQILAVSEDGHIEAIKHKKLPWEGWMWHPEREVIFNNIDQMRLKRLVNNEKQ
jgi:N5-(cytidine 5'-diphosphoramidyl)-L-glutamine hydrolase